MTDATGTRARRLVASLPDRVRVGLDDLRRAHARCFPELVATAGARDDLDTLLRTAADLGLLELPAPAGRSWDRTAAPALPTFVTRPGRRSRQPAGTSATRRLRGRVWHPQLVWAARLSQVSPAQLADLDAVDTWLRGGGGESVVVPREERSLQVFGHEKHVAARLGTSSVWRDGRLDEQLLRCVAPVPPMSLMPLAATGTLLIVENRATFWSCVEALRGQATPVAAVGWGQGNYLPSLVPNLQRLPLSITRIRYFGDLDQRGLRFPIAAAAAAATAGLPAVAPSRSLYALLERHGVPATDKDGPVTAPDAQALTGWLPAAQRAWAAGLLQAGHRCAQEAVGLEVLAGDREWAHRL